MMPQTPTNNRQTLIIVGVVALIIVSVVAYFLIASSHKKTPKVSYNPNSGQTYDPNSHQTVSNPTGKGPEINSTSGAPIYLGISNLVNYGLSNYQLNSLKTAFLNYSNSLSTHIKQVSVNVDSIQSSQSSNAGLESFTISFNVVMDQKATYAAQITYSTPTQMELVLTNSAGNQVFDSGVLGSP